MKSAYIFHDAFSDAVSDWYPWMKSSLEGLGYFVVVPSFPTPGGQSLESWKAVAKPLVQKWDNDTIVIGHGTGGLLAMRLLEDSNVSIHGLFIVAGYAELIGHAGYDRVNETFLKPVFNWSAIKNHAMVTEVFAGQNDPFVPAAASQVLAQNLGTNLQVIPDGGHITRADGFVQCVPVLQGIKESMSAIDKSISTEAVSVPDVQPEPKPAVPDAPIVLEKPIAKEASARTMYADMSRLVNSNSGSVASSLLNKARADEEIKDAVSPGSAKNVLYIIGAVIATVAALGLVGYVVMQQAPAQVAQRSAPITSIILADTHVKIDLAGKQSYAVAQSVRAELAKPMSQGTIRDIVYANGTARASLKQVLEALSVSAPLGIGDELNDPDFMHGETSFGQTGHFLAIPIAHYDTAFGEMKSWEPTMVRDLGIFFGLPEAYLKSITSTGPFSDKMITNHPVRALYYHTPTAVTFDEPGQVPSMPEQPQKPVSYVEYLKRAEEAQKAAQAAAQQNTSPIPVAAPYKEGELMLAYFFISDRLMIVTDSTDLIPELLKRYANSQIYQAK